MLGRELAFVVSHTIHHQAMIAVLALNATASRFLTSGSAIPLFHFC